MTVRTETPCWQRIGVMGDRSCPELATVTHCHNCPVFTAGAGDLFDRTIPDDYLDWLTGTIAAEQTSQARADRTLLVFRVAQEWFAIDATSVRTVAPLGSVRRLPHRRDRSFQGLTSVRGELVPCISLAALLSLPDADGPIAGGGARRLVVVVEDRDGAFAIEIDEARGVVAVPAVEIRATPDTVRQEVLPVTAGLQSIEDLDVTILDADALFERMMGALV
jgi:chemotaxis-related protein WspD